MIATGLVRWMLGDAPIAESAQFAVQAEDLSQVVWALRTLGLRNAGTPFETASTPVRAEQPEENARRIRQRPDDPRAHGFDRDPDVRGPDAPRPRGRCALRRESLQPDGHAVRDRLDTRQGGAARGERAEDQEDHGGLAEVLRGVREASTAFAIPTYLFIGSVLLMIATGLVRWMLGDAPIAESHEADRELHPPRVEAG
jgi:hypothetical protein